MSEKFMEVVRLVIDAVLVLSDLRPRQACNLKRGMRVKVGGSWLSVARRQAFGGDLVFGMVPLSGGYAVQLRVRPGQWVMTWR